MKRAGEEGISGRAKAWRGGTARYCGESQGFRGVWSMAFFGIIELRERGLGL